MSGSWKQAPLREILDAILLANGYSYRSVGNSLVVQASSEVGSANPLFQSVTIPIRHGDINEIVNGAQLLVSAKGKVQALTSARSILVVDYPDRVESVAQFVRQMDDEAARLHGGTVFPDDGLDRFAHGTQVYGDVGGIGNKVAILVKEGAGKVEALFNVH